MAPLSRIIAVFGATGRQGGAVCRSLLKSKQNFRIRAITRNPSSDKARELADLGAEVVQANGFNDKEMLSALDGAWGFWLNTNRFDPALLTPGGPDDEDFGRQLVSIAAQAGVKVLVYSTAVSPTVITNGKAPMPGMDRKHRVEMFARTFQEFDAVVGAFPGWDFDIYLVPTIPEFGGFPNVVDSDGYLTFTSPRIPGEGKIPTLSIDNDLGEMVHGIFLDPGKWKNQTVQIMSDVHSYEHMVKSFTEVTGKQARYVPMDSYDDFPTGGDWVKMEIVDLCRYIQFNNGWYFGAPANPGPCKSLKDAAREDKGLSPQPPMTMKEHIEGHFGR